MGEGWREVGTFHFKKLFRWFYCVSRAKNPVAQPLPSAINPGRFLFISRPQAGCRSESAFHDLCPGVPLSGSVPVYACGPQHRVTVQ